MLEAIKAKLDTLSLTSENLRVIFEVEKKQKLILSLTQEMSNPGFWDNSEKSSSIVKQLKALKTAVEPWVACAEKLKELKELAEIVKDEDLDLIKNLSTDTDGLEKQVEKLEFQALLGGEFDPNSAILSINAGAGGTESCDWVGMLLRMYTRYAEKKGYSVKTIDLLPGEEAGVKNVTLLVEGAFAYGYLKAERGVHRLVRISPFDANKRRHTSFASVDVIPEVEEGIDIKLEESDLRVDVYRSKGAGGQSVNTTDSAVRITHLPTGLVAQCQNERSQFQNKQTALKILKARIYELEREKKEQELAQHATQKKKIEWGSQIRSYVMQPYTLVKDHRTDFETGDVNKIMDGGLDEFIEAFLKWQRSENKG
ncbi:MAG: peptide chain release factor 2 [Candidatus Omnitrophica bacterium]|nr:peptide chain release factor 2 [Candidatus Omnitrophota bacterium]MDD5653259.1 peptide chain release factor 2 [Candidatus Omnitrophota bacterium]